MNREAYPLILGVISPIILASLILMDNYKFSLLDSLKNIDMIYYIVMLPIFLGLLVAVLHWREQR
ncbi:MAG: hypothetical protein DRN12_06250 [Thermoplasmata archaeon]|nr:MAG: hypothetical protein DRN12_06250 [Thermoplasmata archaeon]